VAIKVLVVDDSAFMRHALSRLLGEAEGIEVVGAASNGEQALVMVPTLLPDVITLDVEMPVLDGLGMLNRLMVEHPTRVIMLSSLTTDGARITFDALAAGAIDFVAKPGGSLSVDIGRVGADLVAKVRAAAGMSDASWTAHRQRSTRMAALARRAADPGATAPPAEPRAAAPAAPAIVSRPRRSNVAARRLVVIASSTGGPSALQVVASDLPAVLDAGVVIVQHMPTGFTASLAKRLAGTGALPAGEASADDLIAAGEIVVAPGDRHLIASLSGRIQLASLPPVNGVRPSADVTLQAVAPIWRERLLCVVLTGMGHDGRDGARAVRQHGGTVIAQDQATSTVWGMPGSIVEAGLAHAVLPLEQIGGAIAAWTREASSGTRRFAGARSTAAMPALGRNARTRAIPDRPGAVQA
jgi:two-component system, chemotaxis family, protein-glutamate methylesterase/glutaminase